MGIRKYIFTSLLFLLLLPANAVGKGRAAEKQRYKIAACDWMMLKRQKLGAFALVKELGGDGVEMDMGGLGKRDTFDNKLRQPHFRKLFKETAAECGVEVPSVAMSGFFGQSFLTHRNYRGLVADCLATMKVMGARVAFLPLGGIKEDWRVEGEARRELVRRLREAGEMAAAEGLVIGVRTGADARTGIRLLKEVKTKGIRIYYNVQDALDNGWDLSAELRLLGRKRICQIHCTDTDGVTLPYNTRIHLPEMKQTLDAMKWSGWLVVERSRDAKEVRNVKKNFGTNIRYLKAVFQQNETHPQPVADR